MPSILTDREVRNAARLWALATVVHTDAAAATDPQEARVIAEAQRQAKKELDRLGIVPGRLQCLADCIRQGRRLRLNEGAGVPV